MSESNVPRVARSLDDLRVGTIVALVEPPERRFIGEVRENGHVQGAWDDGEVARFVPDDGAWFILSDPPPEPVTVSREAFDRLATVLEWRKTAGGSGSIEEAARALVDEVKNR